MDIPVARTFATGIATETETVIETVTVTFATFEMDRRRTVEIWTEIGPVGVGTSNPETFGPVSVVVGHGLHLRLVTFAMREIWEGENPT